MLTKKIGGREIEYTKPIEFKPAKKPEEATQGDVIRFMYSSSLMASRNSEQKNR